MKWTKSSAKMKEGMRKILRDHYLLFFAGVITSEHQTSELKIMFSHWLPAGVPSEVLKCPHELFIVRQCQSIAISMTMNSNCIGQVQAICSRGGDFSAFRPFLCQVCQ